MRSLIHNLDRSMHIPSDFSVEEVKQILQRVQAK